jgi:tetratricopeptide (TPR) repeat protein
MYGHELVRMGHTQEAIQQFARANDLEEAYYRTEKIAPQYDWHHAHNLQFLALSYALLGEDRSADRLLHQAFLLPAANEFLAYNRKAWPEFLLDHGRNGDALEAAMEMSESQWPMARLAGHGLADLALIALNRLDEADKELSLAEKESEQLPQHVANLPPYPAALQGLLLLRSGNQRQGEQVLVQVMQSAQTMPGPDAWLTTVFLLESIAHEARAAGDWDLARYAAEQMLQHDPLYAGGHYAIGLVAEHLGETEGARVLFSQAAMLWADADPGKPELLLVRKKLAISP